MKIFLCPSCGQVVYFESVRCTGCGSRLAFLPSARVMVAILEPQSTQSSTDRSSVHEALIARDASRAQVRLCANFAEYDACNWTIPAEDPDPFCLSCRLNEVIPNIDGDEARLAWKRLETAKRRLVYTLLSLELPLRSRKDDPEMGLAFAFKASVAGSENVMTGHADGVITINIAEADDAHRERTRALLGEKYRSLLGHFRHESGHYFWQRLIEGTPWHEEFRTLFGDESAPYSEALARHYDAGPSPLWSEYYVSPYAAAHPWEDWAESWAHYLHIIDTLETARAYGIALQPRPTGGTPAEKLTLRTVSLREFDSMISAWIPLTLALNDFNRGMGLPDLYPFALSSPAVEKMAFVHRVLHERRDADQAVGSGSSTATASQ